MTVVFTDGERREKMRVERKEEKQHLPLISSVIVTAIISCGAYREKLNNAISPLLVFNAFFSTTRQRQYQRRRSWRGGQDSRQEGEE